MMNPEIIDHVKTFAPMLSNVPQLLFENNNVTVDDEMKRDNQKFLEEFKRPTLAPAVTAAAVKAPKAPKVTWQYKPVELTNFTVNRPSASATSDPSWDMLLNKSSLKDVNEIIDIYKKTSEMYYQECLTLKATIEEFKAQIHMLKEALGQQSS